jgi:hypothetical protein
MTCRLRWRENLAGMGGFKTLLLTLQLRGGGDGWRERVWQQELVDIVAAPDWSESGGPEGSNYASDRALKLQTLFRYWH